ncbi:MAG TPA: ATP-binding protein [Steroidobacteraceae bacterium]|nr:ATP-binding protein [Steroidobacteraceae bacterium]
MEYLNFPIVALGAALICLIGVTLYAISQRGSLRSRDEQLVVARAQAYAMLELSQAGVLFLDREHKIMGEASSAAPELLGHTCSTGTAFVQVIAELVDVKARRETVAYLETLWQADPSSMVDATQNPLARVHSGSRHLAIRFARLVVDGRVHHIIVSIERISAPRVVPHTIEVPVLDEDTFARRLAGETGTRPALDVDSLPQISANALEAGAAEQPAAPASNPVQLAADTLLATSANSAQAVDVPSAAAVAREQALGPLDVTEDSLPSVPKLSAADVKSSTGEVFALSLPPLEAAPAATLPTEVGNAEQHLATTITSPQAAQAAALPASDANGGSRSPAPDPSAIVDPADARLSGVLKEVMRVEAGRLENFLGEARDKAGQLRAIIKLPAREPQAFREKLVLILELIRGIHARAQRLPLPSVCERAEAFETALGKLRDKETLSGNDFLPIAVKLDDLLSHLAIQGEVVTRLREWRVQNGVSGPQSTDITQRSATMTGTTIRQPRLRGGADSTTIAGPPSETQRAKRLSDLSQESLEEMAQFLADMYSKRVSLVCVGLEDVPASYRRTVEKILGQLIHNAVRHGLETPADRAVQDKPETGTVAIQFLRAGADGYQLSVQDDGRGLDHDKIRAEAVRQGVLTADAAASIDARKLASLIFRPGFTTAADGARGIGMDVVRDLVNKAGGRVGIATKPGEYTRFRITLPHEKSASGAAVA